jgi:hypothetical protein
MGKSKDIDKLEMVLDKYVAFINKNQKLPKIRDIVEMANNNSHSYAVGVQKYVKNRYKITCVKKK